MRKKKRLKYISSNYTLSNLNLETHPSLPSNLVFLAIFLGVTQRLNTTRVPTPMQRLTVKPKTFQDARLGESPSVGKVPPDVAWPPSFLLLPLSCGRSAWVFFSPEYLGKGKLSTRIPRELRYQNPRACLKMRFLFPKVGYVIVP